jgi:hypothetical protein
MEMLVSNIYASEIYDGNLKNPILFNALGVFW